MTKVGAKAHRVVTAPTDQKRLQPTVEPLPKGSSFVSDEADLTRRLDDGRTFAAMVETSTHPWAAAEYQQAKKFTLQRGGAPGWWVVPEGMIVKEAEDMDEAISIICETLLSYARHPPSLATRYKQHTNHGWPDYGDSDLSYVLHSLWAASSGLDWDSFHRNGLAIASAMGQEDTPFSSIMFSRSGPLAKPVAAYEAGDKSIWRVGTLMSAVARKRLVLGNSSGGNMALKHAVDALKGVVYQLPQLYHPGGPSRVASRVAARASMGTRLMSDDVTSYDTNVRPNHLASFRKRLHALFGFEGWEDFKSHWGDMSLLSPSLTTTDEAWLYTRRGGIASGTIDTSVDGTLVNAARVLTCVAYAMGRSIKETWGARGTWWDFFVQGDDTLLDIPPHMSETKYVEKSNALGYPCKLDAAPIFLMHVYDRGGGFAPLASRVYQQTVFNEYGGECEEVELLSFAARTEHLWGRNPWAGVVDRMLGDGPCFRKYQVRPSAALSAISKPEFMLGLNKALRSSRKRKVEARLRDIADRSPLLSDYASRLLSPEYAPLSTADRDTARSDSLKIAGYMGLSEDERPSLSSLQLSANTQDLLTAVSAGS